MNDFDTELRKETRECVKQLRLIDDEFMKVVFEDKASVEQVLRVIPEKDLTVKKVKTEYTISNLKGRSVRIDIFAVDENGMLYGIEMQKDNDGAEPQRARYISSLMDSGTTKPGGKSPDLHETYVIFITEKVRYYKETEE